MKIGREICLNLKHASAATKHHCNYRSYNARVLLTRSITYIGNKTIRAYYVILCSVRIKDRNTYNYNSTAQSKFCGGLCVMISYRSQSISQDKVRRKKHLGVERPDRIEEIEKRPSTLYLFSKH
ncbi:hypothetical protein V1477_018115 [Vespula maculifrons]|uniref:Uncharacterized protein n=1 Tax=Vespula maculifrons TaxID=7453 RepID=A0ABD2B0A1_VESMC